MGLCTLSDRHLVISFHFISLDGATISLLCLYIYIILTFYAQLCFILSPPPPPPPLQFLSIITHLYLMYHMNPLNDIVQSW